MVPYKTFPMERDLKYLKDFFRSLKTFYSIFRIKAAEGLQYRIAALSGAVVSIFFALIEILVFTVFYRYANNSDAGLKAGFTLHQLITYVWFAQTLFIIQPMNIDSDILGKITNGDVGIEMCRPLDLYYHWFAKNAAGRITPLLLRGSVIFLAGILMPPSIRIMAPASVSSLLFSLLSFVSAFFLCTAYANFVCAVRLNITWGEGPTYIIMLVAGVLSGTYLPLQLWPQFLQKFLLFQPFAGYMDIPARLYLGLLPGNNAVLAITLQLLWTLGFILAGKRILAVRLKKIIIQGG